MSNECEEYELDEEELREPKPLSPERRAEIDEMMSEIASAIKEING